MTETNRHFYAVTYRVWTPKMFSDPSSYKRNACRQYQVLILLKHSISFAENLTSKLTLTSTPSLTSSTSIWNFVPLLDCLVWLPISDLHFPPLENSSPSSFSTSLVQKQNLSLGFDNTNSYSKEYNAPKQLKPAISSSFHRAQLVFSLSKYIHRLRGFSPWIGIQHWKRMKRKRFGETWWKSKQRLQTSIQLQIYYQLAFGPTGSDLLCTAGGQGFNS
jgi:hypothetical protein